MSSNLRFTWQIEVDLPAYQISAQQPTTTFINFEANCDSLSFDWVALADLKDAFHHTRPLRASVRITTFPCLTKNKSFRLKQQHQDVVPWHTSIPAWARFQGSRGKFVHCWCYRIGARVPSCLVTRVEHQSSVGTGEWLRDLGIDRFGWEEGGCVIRCAWFAHISPERRSWPMLPPAVSSTERVVGRRDPPFPNLLCSLGNTRDWFAD